MRRISLISISILVCCLLATTFAASQCFTGNTAVGPGELLTYDVSYQVGPVWTNIALVTFSTVKEVQGGKDVLHMKLNGRTYPTYDHLFKVRDSYESWVVSQTWQPVKFQRYTTHDDNTVLLTQFFYPAQSFLYYNLKVNKDPVTKGQVSLAKCMNDMVSSLYFPRTIEIENLRPGTVIPLSVLYNNEPTTLKLVAQGKGIIKTRDGKSYHCSKFVIKMNSTISFFKENSDLIVWLTADKNKLPVYVEATLKVGTVKIYLKEARGMLNPMTALLKI
ncbi:MAG: DUF3108 domain-containing protein [Bacteroidota bacterium]